MKVLKSVRMFTVAPPAGAWIETGMAKSKYTEDFPSRPPRARGLKLDHAPDDYGCRRRRAPRGRVD